MIKTTKKLKYSDEAFDFVSDLVRLKNVVIEAQKQEIQYLRNLLTRRIPCQESEKDLDGFTV